MSRDALLVILAIVVAANFVFLAEVALLNRRRTARERAATSAAAPAAVAALASAPAATAAEPLGPRLVPHSEVRSSPEPAAALTPTADDPARAAETRASRPDLKAAPDPAPVEPVAASAPDATAAGRTTAPGAGEPMTRRSRTRRFAMPRLDEDRGRTEAAINAFLGEPSLTAGSPQQHRPRRRSRRHRAPNDGAAPMIVVATLAGWEELRRNGGPEAASRFAEALASTLRGTLRSGDELMELGGGRLRIVVNADEEGARALIVRATAICDPWLRAAPVKLELRARAIDPAATSAPPGAAASAAATMTRALPAAARLPFPGPASRHRSNGGMTAPGDAP